VTQEVDRPHLIPRVPEAKVTTHVRRWIRVTAPVVVALAFVACGGGDTASPTPDPQLTLYIKNARPFIAALTISTNPGYADLVALGSKVPDLPPKSIYGSAKTLISATYTYSLARTAADNAEARAALDSSTTLIAPYCANKGLGDWRDTPPALQEACEVRDGAFGTWSDAGIAFANAVADACDLPTEVDPFQAIDDCLAASNAS
jgi:hypothetical protein